MASSRRPASPSHDALRGRWYAVAAAGAVRARTSSTCARVGWARAHSAAYSSALGLAVARAAASSAGIRARISATTAGYVPNSWKMIDWVVRTALRTCASGKSAATASSWSSAVR
jgi:hypothetical protein